MARRPRQPAAVLRGKLDALAAKVADEAMDAPLNQKVAALKVAGAYWALSQRRDGEANAEGEAWEGYAMKGLQSNGKDEDAATH